MSTSDNSSERKVATPTLIAVITAVVALLLGFGWGRQSAELDASTTTTQASTTTAPIRTTTTASPVQTATANLRRALNNADAAALLDLATSYEAMDRAFDNADQAAFLAVSLATNSGDEASADLMREFTKGTLDDLDFATFVLSLDMRQRLRDQLGPIDLTAVNHYLSLVPSSPSAFDRFLEAIGFEPNLTEIYALLDALN